MIEDGELKTYLIFEEIRELILNKRDLDDRSEGYVRFAKSFFKTITDSLEKGLEEKRKFNKQVSISSGLKKIVDAFEGEENSKDYSYKIKHLNNKIHSIHDKLSYLERNSIGFYHSKYPEEIFEFITDLLPCFIEAPKD